MDLYKIELCTQSTQRRKEVYVVGRTFDDAVKKAISANSGDKAVKAEPIATEGDARPFSQLIL